MIKFLKNSTIVFILLFIMVFTANAQKPSYLMQIKNDQLVSSTEYIFDVYIQNVPTAGWPTSFELNGVQLGLLINNAVLNSSTITPSIVAGYSDLVVNQQQTTANLSIAGSGATYGLKMTLKSQSAGNGTTIGNTPVRVCRIKLVSNAASGFAAGTQLNFRWNTSTTTPWKTAVFANLPGNTPLTTASGVIPVDAPPYVNPILNTPVTAFNVSGLEKNVSLSSSQLGVEYQLYKDGVAEGTTIAGTGSALSPASWENLSDGVYTIKGTRTATFYTDVLMNGSYNVVSIVAPSVFNVTGGGSYCVGSAGVSVGLDGSQDTYSYQLYKDNVAEGLPLAGTGAALTWNNLTAGVYTVKATDGATTAMTGSATVTATALPATPVVNVVDNCDGTSTLTITNPEVGATFAWTGGLDATNPTTANVSGNYSVTQTLGCTSLASADAIAAPKATPATPVASVMDNCGNSEFSISNLDAGATLTWYDGVLAVHTGNNYTVNNIVTLTAKQEKNGCTSNASNAVTSAPTVAVTPSVAIAASANGVCAGTSVTFTPTPVNGGATPSYEWFVGAVSQGTSATFTYVPVDGDVVSCVMTSAEACVTIATATSNAVNMIISTPVTPSVTINEANYACQGTQLTYTPIPVNGGAAPTYEWYVGAIPQGSGSTFTYTPTNGDNVFCFMTSNAACVTSTSATSNIVNVFVASPMAVSVSMNAVGGNTVCAGTTVNFTASGTGGGAMPIYEFFVNNISVQSGAMMSSYSYVPANGDVVKCVFTSDMGCVSGNPATSSEIAMIVNAPVEPTVSIVADANNVCAGTTVTYTATPVNGGTAAYQWKVNGNPVGTGLATYAYAPVNGDVITCVMTSDLGCVTSATATSNAVNMTINAPVTPSITIAADINNVCAGTTITFTATPVNGGNPTYLWKVNGFDAGVPSSPTFASNLFANDDVVSCIMTSDLGCVTSATATSNAANVSINAALPVSVSIVADANNVCAGTTVTYTATPVNGGIAHYNWHINGNTQGNDSPTFAYQPANGDQVYVLMTSDLACVSGNPATSNTVTTTVNNPVMPSVSISQSNNGNPILPGTNVTFTATPTNGGTNPTYVWKVLSNPGISTGTTPTFTYAPAAGDLVTVEMTSDLACVAPATASDNSMTIIYLYTPTVAIAADANNVCAGTTVTYTATPTYGGGSPAYQWMVNGSNVGTDLNTYSYIPVNGDIVTCVLTSSMFNVTTPTATSNAISMIVNAPVTPSVSIAASANNVVAGTSVTFTATPTNGGVPAYQWKINGGNVGTGLSTYTYAPANGDIVSCVMTSNLGCVTSTTATSNDVTMIVTPAPFLTNTWLGGTNAWNLASNWSLGIVPLANHNVVIPVSANYPFNLTPAVCHDFTLESGAEFIQANTLTIGGTVKVKQFLSANKWHFFSSPINNATAYSFSSANPNNIGQTLYLQRYNESWDGGAGSPWVDITTGWAEQMSAGKGYEAWSNNDHTVTLEGTQLNSANVTIPLTWSSPNIFLKGYNLIGNPYPSSISVVSSNAWPLVNALPAIYLWSHGFGNYLTWDGAMTGSLGGTIPANQSFFVVANGPGASYTIPSGAKTFGGSFYKSTVADRLTLNVTGNNYQDQATIRFDANATNNYDNQYDVKKLFGINEAPQFYSVMQNEELSINALPSLTGTVVVPMALTVGANTTYTITASEMSSFANGTTITLEDTKTGTFTNLMQQAVYTFTASPADNANRFKVHFGVNGINENANGNISIYSNSNVIYVNNSSNEVVKEIVVMNVLGQEILNKKAANTTVNTITMDVASAYYVVKVVTENKVYTEKVYVR